MSHISAIYGTDNDAEILSSLYTIANVSCLAFDTNSILTSILEHGWVGSDSRGTVDLFESIHPSVVRLGQQLFRRVSSSCLITTPLTQEYDQDAARPCG